MQFNLKPDSVHTCSFSNFAASLAALVTIASISFEFAVDV